MTTNLGPNPKRPPTYRWYIIPLDAVRMMRGSFEILSKEISAAMSSDGFVCIRGKLAVVSTLDHAELPDGSGDIGPQWHVSISVARSQRRATDDECERTLRDFDLVGAEEDNHEPGRARHFWLPVDPARRVECECKTTDEVIVERDGHRWSNPKNATPATCNACSAVRMGALARCPLHPGAEGSGA